MLHQLMQTPCTITRVSQGGTTDELGNDVPTETLVATTCEVQQADRTEDEIQGGPARGTWDGYFPAGTELRSGDTVEVDGEGVFEVVGDPWQAKNPRTDVLSHVEATLDLTRGAYEPS